MIDPSIPLGVRVPAGINPMEMFQQISRLREQEENARALREQRRVLAEQHRQQIEDARLKAADRLGFGQAVQAGGGVREATIEAARRVNPNVVPQVVKLFDELEDHLDKSRKSREESDKLAREAHDHEKNYLGGLADWLIKAKAAPEVIKLGFSHVDEQLPQYTQKSHALMEHLLALPDPAQRLQVLEAIRGHAPAYRQIDKTPAVPGSFEEFSTATPERQQAVLAARSAYEAAGRPPVREEHSAAYKEWQDHRAAGGTLSFDAYQTMDANRKQLKDAAADVDIHAAAKNIVTNPRDLSTLRSISSLRGDQRLKLYNEIKRQDATFDPGLIDRRVKFLDEYEDPKGRAAINRGSMNNILMHAADLSAVNQDYRRSDARIVNIPIKTLAKQFSTQWTAFQVPMAVLKDEVALYFAGPFAPHGDQLRTWNEIVNDTATPAQIEEFTKDLIHVGLRRANTFNQQFKTMMGYDDPNLLTPDAVAAGQQLGLGNEVKKYGSGGRFGRGTQAGVAQPVVTAPPPTKSMRKKNNAGVWVINDGTGWARDPNQQP